MKRTSSKPITAPSEHRQLRIFASDPMQAVTPGSCITIEIPNEKLTEGPMGSRFEVIDYDGTQDCFYPPVDLNKQAILKPTESDPGFHQQMLYAVAMRTLENFERAMGRRIKFYNSPYPRLRLLPHAFHGENACYVSDLNAILFGYFRSRRGDSETNQSSPIFFTCLSHDIIVHELTHAVIDRLRERFMEPTTNPDVRAFHEGFADIVALFQHFSYPEFLKAEIQKNGANNLSDSLLVELARQFASATGSKSALRKAFTGSGVKRLSPDILDEYLRGSILVAAVFDAFFITFKQRTCDLKPDQVNRIAEEASSTAQLVLNTCIRAFDYMPPVDLTFGDYLRALFTADYELNLDGKSRLHDALIEAFAKRGIYPENVKPGEPLIWEKAPDCFPRIQLAEMQKANQIHWKETALASEENRSTGDSSSEVEGVLEKLNGELKEEKGHLANCLHMWAKPKERARQLRLDPSLPVQVGGFHISVREKDGQHLTELIFQLIQHKDEVGGITLWGGTTFVTETDGHIRYVISKPLPSADDPEEARRRREQQRAYMAAIGLDDRNMAYGDEDDLKARFKERMRIASFLEGVIP